MPSPATSRSPSLVSSPWTAPLALFALATGGFSIGTGEFVIMGLLPDVATDLKISIPSAGHLISAYALGVVVGAPVLAVLGARWPRKRMLLVLMFAYALGNIISTLVPSYAGIMGARFFSGLPHGTYFGVASLVAADLVPYHKRTQAVAMVMLGLSVATLVGVPLAAALGQWAGWRWAFVLVSGFAVLAMMLLQLGLAYTPGNPKASPLRELSALKRSQVWLTLGIGAIGFGGMFSIFSYIKPTMMNLAHVPEVRIPLILAMFGLGTILGNVLGSRLADKNLELTIRGLLVYAMVTMLFFLWSAHHAYLGSFTLLLVGMIVALGPALQTRLMDVAGDAQTLAAALNHSAFNVANALGAWLGGLTISAGLGWTSTAWVGACLALGGLIIHAYSLKRMKGSALY
ncbi:MFS transporter [Alcaligenes endophyticus]|uniref:MFS transporter n=1 Tax=Alcaligenes endophyticus TaxID=1929088 RepID=A0ABT8EIE9_9BURK|nr:MFS transporter [Alcaligenes endophyticus]MCX5592596.1 MFS transporter [Alcaligenes endophyticus]MDN4121056.1 MFS transporter [Alcaligenes endophyticus]